MAVSHMHMCTSNPSFDIFRHVQELCLLVDAASSHASAAALSADLGEAPMQVSDSSRFVHE
jgi:hypothetical protein